MENYNVVKILKSFSKKEIILFERFLLSPYFTEGKNIRSKIVVKYFKLLKGFYPSFDFKEFTKEFMFSRLYPNLKYKDEVMRKINSDLLKLEEEFLIQLELEKDEIGSRKFLINQLIERDLGSLFNKSFDSMINYLNGTERDTEFFYQTYISWEKYLYFYIGKKNYYKLEDSFKNINNFSFMFCLIH